LATLADPRRYSASATELASFSADVNAFFTAFIATILSRA
jgi:hypothetical protein